MNLPIASATSLIALLTFDTGAASAAAITRTFCPDTVCAGTARIDPAPMEFGATTMTLANALAGGAEAEPGAALLAAPAPTGIMPLTGTSARTSPGRPHGGITSSLATGVTFLDSDPVATPASVPRDSPAKTPDAAVSLGTLGLEPARMDDMTVQTTEAAFDPCVFPVALPSNTVAGSANLTILVTGKGVERASTTMTVFTDESVAYGGAGDAFAYAMTTSVPEPVSSAATGAGLAGLAFMRRRRLAPRPNRSAA